jgi:ubiquinone biosynthesis protein COQ9
VTGDGPDLAAARQAIFAAALAHVPFDGWSDKAIAAGIRDAGIGDPLCRLAFPGGPADFAEYFSTFADQRMVDAVDAAAIKDMRVRERITSVVRLRLIQAEAEREAVRALMNWLALPGQQALGVKCLTRTVDAMWRAVGDTSTDFNFYSKRAILAGVLAATVLYWLGDETDGHADTFAFLDRRFEDVMKLEKAKGRAREIIGELPDPFRILRDITAERDKSTGDGGDDDGADDGADGGGAGADAGSSKN